MKERLSDETRKGGFGFSLAHLRHPHRAASESDGDSSQKTLPTFMANKD
jgi:hypothetical protein